MQKLRIGTIYLAVQSGALQTLCSSKPQGSTGPERSRFSYRLGCIRSALLHCIDERSEYYTQRKGYEDEHLEGVEKDGQVISDFKAPKPVHKRAFDEAIQGLMQAEISVDLEPVTLKELDTFGIELTGEQMSFLNFVVIPSPVAEAEPA